MQRSKNNFLRIFFILSLFLLFNGLRTDAQVRVIKFSTLDSLMQNTTDEVRVLNFWATWCKPCVQELPYFLELSKNYAASNVKVFLISLDFKKELDSRVKTFVEKNNITPEVLLLDEPDYNS